MSTVETDERARGSGPGDNGATGSRSHASDRGVSVVAEAGRL